MLEYLFGSKTRLKVLHLFYREPGTRFFVRELARLAETQVNAVRRELATLMAVGVIKELTEEHEGRRKFYVLDTESLIHPELSALLMKSALLSEQAFIRALRSLENVSRVLLSGRFVGNATLPTDVLVVGAVSERTMRQLADQFEKKIGFAIRYTILTADEFKERKQMMDRFLYAILDGKPLTIVERAL
ncbi:MAG: hypothetical protein AAB579_02240 [Patescibacteria group bacterium]